MIRAEHVKVGLTAELLPDGRRQLVAHAEVDGQLGGNLPVVLHEERVRILE